MGWVTKCWRCDGTGKPRYMSITRWATGQQELLSPISHHVCDECGGSGIRFTPWSTDKPLEPVSSEWWYFRQIEKLAESPEKAETQ